MDGKQVPERKIFSPFLPKGAYLLAESEETIAVWRGYQKLLARPKQVLGLKEQFLLGLFGDGHAR